MKCLTYRDEEHFKSLNQLTLHAVFSDSRERAEASACWQETLDLLNRVQRLMSTGEEYSDIGRLNAASPYVKVPIDRLTAEVLARAAMLSDLTGGAFDPSVFPLVDAWGFSPQRFRAASGPREEAAPDAQTVAALRELVGMDGFAIGGSDEDGWWCVKKKEPVQAGGIWHNAMVDLGAIAKGYVADRALQIAQAHGFVHAMYSTGSSIALTSSGLHGGPATDRRAFRVGVVDPRSHEDAPRNLLQLYVRNRSIATSGDYGRYRYVGKTRVSHELDGRTGCPAAFFYAPEVAVFRDELTDKSEAGLLAVGSLTLLGPSAMDCDALSTALCVMGPQEAVTYFNDCLKGAHDLMMVLLDRDRMQAKIVTSLDARSYRIIDRQAELISRRRPDGTVALEHPVR